jgi:dinuclear metal center YbgI/SA1388 family protein
MAKRDDIIRYCDELLSVKEISDYGPIGLQVEGAPEVAKIVTGVSGCKELFEEAARRGAQMVIVHHGILWDRDPRVIAGVAKGRIKTLLDADITLLGYHLPLDMHPEIGNNAQIAKKLALVDAEPFGEYNGMLIGVRGRMNPPCTSFDFVSKLTQALGPKPLVYEYGRGKVDTVGIVSGGAADLVTQAVEAGLTAFVTGQPMEPTKNYCKEARIHLFAPGHYYTEKWGVLALGGKLKEEFGVDVEYVEIPNEV